MELLELIREADERKAELQKKKEANERVRLGNVGELAAQKDSESLEDDSGSPEKRTVSAQSAS